MRGYTRNDGTYVEPHYQTRPNNNLNDNFSTKGNVNPYTGREGWIDPNRNLYGSGSSNGQRSGYSNWLGSLSGPIPTFASVCSTLASMS
ncbi:hypothetical protein [Rhodomicrobium lacus]|uniref:hypothetical protein n=1 Tax=Rhodomicrobium lacus TaxID=2498452 RepID=UPI0026E1A762|nr:hypothetical protein [Rhodomicrobium lacus]WKW49614.1 hypothetical protein QMO75_09905 [Rhodomicrobium lacus]